MIHRPSEIDTGIFSRIRSITGDVAEIALAEIEAGIVPEHQAEALERRLVEAELLLELCDEFRVEPLRAAILARRIARPVDLASAAKIRACRRKAVGCRSPPWPVSSAITCSTGPPGANWITTKEIAMMPNMVGIISKQRGGGYRLPFLPGYSLIAPAGIACPGTAACGPDFNCRPTVSSSPDRATTAAPPQNRSRVSALSSRTCPSTRRGDSPSTNLESSNVSHARPGRALAWRPPARRARLPRLPPRPARRLPDPWCRDDCSVPCLSAAFGMEEAAQGLAVRSWPRGCRPPSSCRSRSASMRLWYCDGIDLAHRDVDADGAQDSR